MALQNFVDMYLDYCNNFLTVEAFAAHWGLSLENAQKIVDAGRLISSIDL